MLLGQLGPTVSAGDEWADKATAVGGDVDAVLSDVIVDRDKFLDPTSFAKRPEVA